LSGDAALWPLMRPHRKEHSNVAVHAIKRGVSFYSFQEEYFLGQLDIEGCIKASADIGALGIEIIPEQMMRGYPNITDDFYRQWHNWMDSYGTTPVASDLFIDTKKFPGRWLTVDEQVESVHRDLEIAHRLGVTEIRAIINTPPEVMEGAAPRAEQLGLRLLLEVHAPFHYEHPWILRHLEVMHRLQSPALGFMTPYSIRSVVVLPAPFGPRRPVMEPSRASKVTPSTACTMPNRFARAVTRIIARRSV